MSQISTRVRRLTDGRVTAGFASVRRQLPITLRLIHVELIPLAAIAASLVIWRMKLIGDPAELVLAAAIAIAVSPVLADPAAVTLAASATSRLWRVVARLTIVAPVAIICWLVARVVAVHPHPDAPPLRALATWVPGRETWMLVAVLVGLVLAIEASVGSGSIAGLAGSSTVLVAGVVALNAPRAIAVLPVDAHWWRWGAALALTATALAAALRDPGLTRRWNHGRDLQTTAVE